MGKDWGAVRAEGRELRDVDEQHVAALREQMRTAAQKGRSRQQAHVALVVDVDGVVSPVHGSTVWGDDRSGYPHGGGGVFAVPVSPRLNMALNALGARPEVLAAWLTSWDRAMRAGMLFPGQDWPTVAHAFAWAGPPVFDEQAARERAGVRWDDDRWWKWWALDAWLDERPEIDTLVWSDDHLGLPFFSYHDEHDVEEDNAMTRATVAAFDLARRGVRALLLSPATDTALTPAHLAEVRAFLDDETVQPPRPTPPTELAYPSERTLRWLDTERVTRSCATCDEQVWYLRYYAVSAVDCPLCGRTFYGPHDITDDLSHSRREQGRP